MGSDKFIFLVSLDFGRDFDGDYETPHLFKSRIIKETETLYLCESHGIATRYRSCIKKSENPSLTPKAAWKNYVDGCTATIIGLGRTLDRNHSALVKAEKELAKL
jgi:hypothetical protein